MMTVAPDARGPAAGRPARARPGRAGRRPPRTGPAAGSSGGTGVGAVQELGQRAGDQRADRLARGVGGGADPAGQVGGELDGEHHRRSGHRDGAERAGPFDVAAGLPLRQPGAVGQRSARLDHGHPCVQQLGGGVDPLRSFVGPRPPPVRHDTHMLLLMSTPAQSLPSHVRQDGLELEVAYCVGGVASPLLANVYLHYVFDLWADWWRRRHARGDVIIVRFADDYIVGFEHQRDAQQFLSDLRERLAKFCLELAPEKTRLIEFGQHAVQRRRARGLGRPESFEFLGFTHTCAKTKSGRFMLKRITISKRMRAKLREVNDELKRRRHQPIPEQGRWLASVVRGHLAYYAVPGNTDAVAAFRTQATRHWYRALRRRSQRSRLNWERMNRLATRWLPPARPASLAQCAIRRPHPRQEPSALAAHAGICAGGRRQRRSLPRSTIHRRGHARSGANRHCRRSHLVSVIPASTLSLSTLLAGAG